MILFACGTELHLLVTFILSTTLYRRQPKALLLYQTNRSTRYYEAARALGLWDEIHLFDPAQPGEAYNDLIQNLVSRADVLHIFSWGFPHFNSLFAECAGAGKPIILTDEGIYTYSPQRCFARWLAQKHDGATLARGFDLGAIREIWLLQPRLYVEPPTTPLQKIDLEAFYTACDHEPGLVDAFRFLFGIPTGLTFNADAIFFRQYFPLLDLIAPEADAWLDDIVCTCFGPTRLAIKNHPAWVNPLVRHPGNTFAGADLPWEALLILQRVDSTAAITLPRVYLTFTSSAPFKSALFGASGTFFFLHHLLERYATQGDETLDDLISVLRLTYPNLTILTPATWENLRSDLETLAQREALTLDLQTLPTPEAEADFLRGLYRFYWQNSREATRRAEALQAKLHQREATLREVIRLLNLTAGILQHDLE